MKSNYQIQNCDNRTYVELKSNQKLSRRFRLLCDNRTYVELKSARAIEFCAGLDGDNRTYVELKYHFFHFGFKSGPS